MKRVLLGAVTLASALAIGAPAPAAAETKTWVPNQGDSINEDTTPVPLVSNKPRTEMVWMDLDPASVPAVNTNKIYVNNCKPNGCVVRGGTGATSIDNSTSQGGWPLNGTHTLTASSTFSDATWQEVVTCLKDVFSPFGVEIVTTNPSPAPHFEIMIAGSPADLGMSNGIGGVSPFSCAEHIPNSLVFAFQKVYGNDVEEICATAAQEVAHSFRLDHVTDPSDPLTYFGYNGRRRFKDAPVTCGSDCVNGSAMGLACTGTNQQTRQCACGTGATQNSAARIRLLFGSGTPTPPTVTITNPKLGANVSPGFPINVTADDDNGIQRVEIWVDGAMTSQLMVGPFAFNAPATLADGTHNVKAIAYDIYGTSKDANVQVVIGKPCGKPADCPKDTDTCIGGRCVPGPGAQGGLGMACNSGPDCASGQCAADANGAKYCVENCELDAGQCPDGFGCLKAGDQGVCWPGYDDGTGGICSAGGPGGAVSLGLAFAAMLFSRRRRRS